MSLRDPRLDHDEQIARDWHAARGIQVEVRHSVWPHTAERLYGDIIGMFELVYASPAEELRWSTEFAAYYRSAQMWADRKAQKSQ